MTEIDVLRSGAKAPRAFVGKAGTLLTRYWARGNWEAREEILRAARWVLKVGKMQSISRSAKVR